MQRVHVRSVTNVSLYFPHSLSLGLRPTFFLPSSHVWEVSEASVRGSTGLAFGASDPSTSDRWHQGELRTNVSLSVPVWQAVMTVYEARGIWGLAATGHQMFCRFVMQAIGNAKDNDVKDDARDPGTLVPFGLWRASKGYPGVG